MTEPSSGAIVRRPRWPWVVLGLGLVWTVLIRVPLILNAEDHLDSDLAVDGLTLIDAVNGHWRWHYPGTPHMGIPPMLSSYPQALIWGANAVTLVTGGTLIWLLIVMGTFWLAWKAYGPSVAGWAILPLIFSSNGTIWLSGRITGGHLLTLAWHILAFVLLHGCLTKGGWLRAAALGLWCGLGLYIDMMFLFTLFGLVPAALLGWLLGGRWRLKMGTCVVFLAAMIAGFVPHEIGRLVDPHDAYPSQFTATFEGSAIREHGRLLAIHCLPRLIAGTELNDFDRLATRGESVHGKVLLWLTDGRLPLGLPGGREWIGVLLLVVFLIGFVRLALDLVWPGDACRKAIDGGTWVSALLIVVAFLLNRNIFNSDNYRYLIYLLTPWSLGFGLVMNGLMRGGRKSRAAGLVLFTALACAMTGTTLRWYQERLHYIDDEWRVVSVGHLEWSQPHLWAVYGHHGSEGFLTYDIPSDVTHLFGGYWDVYRMAFLSGKRVVGIPYPIYPNRFVGWSRGLGPNHGKLMVLGLRAEGDFERWRTARNPRTIPRSSSSRVYELYNPATRTDWRAPFRTVWQNDGRDPAELDRIRVIVPSVDQAGR